METTKKFNKKRIKDGVLIIIFFHVLLYAYYYLDVLLYDLPSFNKGLILGAYMLGAGYAFIERVKDFRERYVSMEKGETSCQ